MEICKRHWDALRQAIADRGLEHLGAKSGRDAMRNIITELEGREAENDFDPLMTAHNMIWNMSLEVCGLELMAGDEQQQCPICNALQKYEAWWIEGPANAVKTLAQEKGLVPKDDPA